MNATDRPQPRQQLLDHLDHQDALGGYSDEAFEQLGRLVEALKPTNPVPAPMDALERVEGRWETLFAHFGARHSAGKPKVHESNLKVQTFNCFPPVPVRVEHISQEIARPGSAYNNVIDFVAADGETRGTIIVRGRFEEDPANRQRFMVEFYRAELQPAADGSEAGLRTALGFAADEALAKDLAKPPRFHSDVIYLDDDLRVNVGGLGGLYVLRRSADQAVSVA